MSESYPVIFWYYLL